MMSLTNKKLTSKSNYSKSYQNYQDGLPRLIPTNACNPCPICNNVKGDCRVVPDETLVLCHSHVDFDSGLSGWKYVRAVDGGVWGVHRVDDGKEFDRESYERYLTRRDKRKKPVEQKAVLSDIERDREIRKVLSQLTLSDSDKKYLLGRGLTIKQIELIGYRSVRKWHVLPDRVSNLLSGTNSTGSKLLNPCDGILCPMPNANGQMVAMRLHNPNHRNNDFAKYLWLSSHSRGVGIKNQNAEIPIAIHYPTNITRFDRIGLCEGSEFKAAIAAERLGYPVIGFTGCHFGLSLKTLKHQINAVKTKINSNGVTFVILPDGGSVVNRNVLNGNYAVVDAISALGDTVDYLWWNQVEKGNNDIDEISIEQLEKAQQLSIDEFCKVVDKQQWIHQQKVDWESKKKLNADIKKNEKFIDFDFNKPSTITLVKSGLGSGKTTCLIEKLKRFKEYGVIGLGYRNTLLLQFNEKANELGFYHLQSDKDLAECNLDNRGLKITNCIDSLSYYQADQFDGKIIIIDEIVSVLKHLLFSKTIKRFSKIKELFSEMVRRCDRLICLDGFLQNWVVDFFRELAPNKEIIVIENEFKADKSQVYLLDGTIDIDEKARVNDKTPWVERLLNTPRPVICSDSRIFGKSIEQLLIGQGKTGVRIDSETVARQDIKDFFTNPNEFIEANKPDFLIYSPSAESGLDVAIEGYFDDLFAFFFGQLDTDSCSQMLARIRDVNVDRFVWLKQFVPNDDIEAKPTNIDKIRANREQSLMLEIKQLISNNIDDAETKIDYLKSIYHENLDVYSAIADEIQSIRNYEFANYRKCLELQLISAGYSVKVVTLDAIEDRNAIDEREKDSKKRVKQLESNQIFDASDKFVGKSLVTLKFDASWEDRCAIEKARLLERLPDIEHSEYWNPGFIKKVKFDEPKLIEGVERLHWLKNPETIKQRSIEKWNSIYNRGTIAPWKVKAHYAKMDALHRSGLIHLIDSLVLKEDYLFNEDSLEIQALLKELSKHEVALGKIGKNPIKFLNRALNYVGIPTKSFVKKVECKSVRFYRLDNNRYFSGERTAIAESIKLKYERLKSVDLEWKKPCQQDTLIENFDSVENSTREMAKSIDGQGVDTVTLEDRFVYKRSLKCNPKNEDSITGFTPPKNDNTDVISNHGKDGMAIAGDNGLEAALREDIDDLTDVLPMVAETDDPEMLRIQIEIVKLPYPTRYREILNEAVKRCDRVVRDKIKNLFLALNGGFPA